MITEEAYKAKAKQAAELLTNQGQKLIEAMYGKMEAYAEQLEYEKAANMLRHIRNLEAVPDKQIVNREGGMSQDVIYFGEGMVLVAKVQEGMLREFEWVELGPTYNKETACDHFLMRRYAKQWPDEIILNRSIDTRRVSAALRTKGAKLPKITLPKRGLKYDLLQLCKQNYEYRMNRQQRIYKPE
ncbi:excinuclease ABC subunit C [compost metagenome]